MYFLLFITFVILQRLSELVISKRNKKWLLQQGAIEYGKQHYPFIVMLHTLFIISMLLEYSLSDRNHSFSFFFFTLFILLLIAKIWVISSLGKFWNTKIYRIPNTALIRKGLYKWVKHPNYIIVVGEIAVIPLIFHLHITAVIFSILNAIMLIIRIREEDKALLL